MLKLFEVKGFKNFHEKISLDFSDVRDYRFNEHCVKDGFLKNVIIYGKNASGKSNFSLALFDIAMHFVDNAFPIGMFGNYLNIACIDGEAEFHYVFQFGVDVVDYVYRKTSVKDITYEKLTLNDRLLVEKFYDESKKDDLSGLHELAPTLNFAFYKDGSIIKYAISNAPLDSIHPLYVMMRYVMSMQFTAAFSARNYNPSDFHKLFANNQALLPKFQELLNLAGIKDTIHIETDVDGEKRLYSAPEYHPPGRVPFFQTASNGTFSLFVFFIYVLYFSNQNPSLLIIDEFDAFYHFELAENIVKKLGELPNTQVVLTSHNTNLLTNRIMRPDCLFILTPEKLTSFVNATDRELREGHNLEKLYMSGEFDE